MADKRPKKTRTMKIQIEISSDVKELSDHDMIIMAAAASSALADKAKQKGFTLDNLIVNEEIVTS